MTVSYDAEYTDEVGRWWLRKGSSSACILVQARSWGAGGMELVSAARALSVESIEVLERVTLCTEGAGKSAGAEDVVEAVCKGFCCSGSQECSCLSAVVVTGVALRTCCVCLDRNGSQRGFERQPAVVLYTNNPDCL